MAELLITVGAVIIISALCSLAEAVLYSVPISHIESMVEEGKRSGRILKRLRQNVDRPITAILSLNTIANTAGAALAGAIAADVFGSKWIGWFSALFTFAILFFSEVVPKTAGVVYSRQLSYWIARPLQILVWLLRPLVILCGLATRLVKGKERPDQISENEILAMARMGQRRGVIDRDELAVIQNILSLEEKIVRQIMTPRTVMFSLSTTTTVEQARNNTRMFTYSRVPVYADNPENIKGIVHRSDVLNAVAEDRADVELMELVNQVHFVQEKTRLNKVLKMFLERGEQMFVVIDEFGGLAGIITLEDVVEEILGREILDEFDQVADMRKLAQQHRRQVADVQEENGSADSGKREPNN